MQISAANTSSSTTSAASITQNARVPHDSQQPHPDPSKVVQINPEWSAMLQSNSKVVKVPKKPLTIKPASVPS